MLRFTIAVGQQGIFGIQLENDIFRRKRRVCSNSFLILKYLHVYPNLVWRNVAADKSKMQNPFLRESLVRYLIA